MTGLQKLIAVLEFNPHHDARGRFASGGGGRSSGGDKGQLIPMGQTTALLHEKPGNRVIIQVGKEGPNNKGKFFLHELSTSTEVRALVQRVGKMSNQYSAVGRVQGKRGFTLIDTTGMGGR